MKWAGVLTVLVILTRSGVSLAATYYVDPNGINDAARDGSASQPWASLSYASGRVTTSGDTIYVQPGTYTDNNTVSLSVGVSIEGAGRDNVTIQTNAAPYILAASNPAGPVVGGNNEIWGIAFDGKSQSSVCIRSYGRSNQLIHDCRFTDFNSSSPFAAIDISGKYGSDGAGGFYRDTYAAGAPSATYFGSAQGQNVPPASTDWAEGVEIYGNELNRCKLYLRGCLSGMLVYNNSIDNTGTVIGGIGHTGYWIRGGEIHDNDIQLGASTLSTIAIELWEVSENLKVYGNITNAWFSIGENITNQTNGTEQYSYQMYGNSFVGDPSSDPQPAIESMTVSNIVIFDNYIQIGTTFQYGIAIWATPNVPDFAMSNIDIHNNVIYGTDPTRDAVEISPRSSQTVSNVTVVNNTIDGIGAAVSLGVADSSSITGTSFQNNLVMNSSYGVIIYGSRAFASDSVITHNDLYNVNTQFADGGGQSTNTTFSSNDTFDPGINASGSRPLPYYEPSSAASAVVDAGTNVGLPFMGVAPDIGAYEYSDAPSSPSPPNPPTALRVISGSGQ